MQTMQPSANQPPIHALVDLLRSGQLDRLAEQARNCSIRWPNSGPVWHLLGLAYLNLGNPEAAIAPLTKAGKLLPKEAEIAEQLAIVLMQSGRIPEAYRGFQRCLTLAPNHPSIQVNLAHLANHLENFSAAEKHCQKALQHNPDQPEALYNLGRALRGQGKTDEAIAAFRKALPHVGNTAIGQNDIGLQLQELGAIDQAASCFRRAIALMPGYAPAHSNLGHTLEIQGHFNEALNACRQAAMFEPQLPGVHANLSGIYNAMQRFKEGEAASRQAISLAPNLAAGFSNLATALYGQNRYNEAETAYLQALAIAPDFTDARNNLGNLFQETQRFNEALACYRKIGNDDGNSLGNAYHCANHLNNWSRRDKDETALRKQLSKERSAIAPFGLLSLDTESAPALQRRAGLLYAQSQLNSLLTMPPIVAPSTHPARDRLKIGYLSADFHEHATMHLLAGVLACHDRARFAINLYSYGPNRQDRGRQQAIDSAEVFRDLNALSDTDAAEQIATDGIDLLIDLKGYTQHSRLGISALRPAPVIISWLGYPGTLGHERLADYIIGDTTVTPPEHAAHFSETLALMPNCYQPNDYRRVIAPRPSRAEAGLPEQGFIFCSFNQSYKFHPKVFDIWCQILGQTPGSTLWLLASTPLAMDNLRREATARGIAPERLQFAERKPLNEHLGRLQLADLALDTYPCGSHTTGSDALWAGVPLLSKIGETFASRVGASLLRAVGLPELIVETWDDYLSLASALAENPEKLGKLRQALLTQRLKAPLFKTEAFTQDLELLFERIWAQHGQGSKTILLAANKEAELNNQ